MAWVGALVGPGRRHTNIGGTGARVVGAAGTITVVGGEMVPAGPEPEGGRTPAGPAGTLDGGMAGGGARVDVDGGTVVVVVDVNGGKGRNVGLGGAGLGVGPVRICTATRLPTTAYHVAASR